MAAVLDFPVTDADHQSAKTFVCVTVTLVTLALAALVARLALKVRSSLRFGWDDYLLIAGLVFCIADWALLLSTISYYVPSYRNVTTWADVEWTIKIGYSAIPCWAISVICIKTSVSLQLLRFQQTKLWRISLYILIGIVVLTSLGFTLLNILQCIPVAATWDSTIVGAKCISHDTFSRISRAQSGISIATDLYLSLFPLTFLYQLRRPMSEKVLVHVLMAMGIAASAASITKTVLVIQWAHDIDSFKVGFQISMWTCVEMLAGIIAACLPSLKSAFQKLLASLGIDFIFRGANSFFRSFTTPTVLATPAHNLSPPDDSSDSSKSNGTLGKTMVMSGGYEELEELSKEKTGFVSTV